uniref:Clone ZZZ264 mRNA sequence n=1 Tax=Schistosoma japonicum TaxID=6182 RepID=Q86FI0_SCHJA|nr:hypothetical protein with ATP/GTP-binding site motif A (P-loop) [Schistosoma japonicum]
MNIALALLFILQLHSIQIQPISGADVNDVYLQNTFRKMFRICDKLLKRLNKITNFEKYINKSRSMIQQIRKPMSDYNVKPKTFIKVTKIIEKIQNAKNSFEKLISLMTEIKTLKKMLYKPMQMMFTMKMLDRDLVNSWNNFQWAINQQTLFHFIPKNLEDAMKFMKKVQNNFENLKKAVKYLDVAEEELQRAMEHQNKMKFWRLNFKTSRNQLQRAMEHQNKINDLHQTTHQPYWVIPLV